MSAKKTQTPAKKTKKEPIPAAVRNAVWIKYVGPKKSTAYCYCCSSNIINVGNFECGHIESEKNGGKVTIDNLRPICSLCNRSMSIRNMEEFMNQYGFKKNKYWDGYVESRCIII